MKINCPEILDQDHPERYTLTVRIHQEQFSYAISNTTVNGSFHYQEIPGDIQPDSFSNFKQAFFENDFFTLPFKKVIILNCQSEFTFVPSIFFKEEDKEAYMRFNFSNHSGKLLVQKIKRPDIAILHRIPEDVYQFLHRSFSNPRFIHHTAPLLNYFQEKNHFTGTKKMIVNLHKNGMDILCFAHDEFIFANYFKCPNSQDFIYYLLYVWKQLKLNQTKDFIFIAGNRIQKKELEKELAQYLSNIIPVNVSHEPFFEGIDADNIPFELSSLSLCEL